jgi:hypothetical protein
MGVAICFCVTQNVAATPCNAIPAGSPWIDCDLAVQPSYQPLAPTAVTFSTSDALAQALFAHAEACALGNTLQIATGFEVLTEGGGYGNVWLETQPMGGAMYGLRNLTLALNNQLVFMRSQRLDGRLPGMISRAGGITIKPTYSWPGNANLSMLQGFYMASPALDVAALMNSSAAGAANAAAFVEELRPVLESFWRWMWSERNSSSGVLWLPGTSDSGEDNSDKFGGFSGPFLSMDMMGYAHDAARALARIASLQGDGAALAAWTARMADTSAALKEWLWREDLGAAFDRERDGAQAYVSTLVHNNVRAMWAGVFDQGMADAFVARHLMNRSEFFTATPLPSIAVSDPHFHDNAGNDWSGPPQGLTFQRAIRALESYGHHAELLLAGAQQRAALAKTMKFPQQIDPFTSQPDSGDCYGPMLLSMLEYTALTTGIAVRPDALLWSAVDVSGGEQPQPAFSYSQQLGDATFTLAAFANGSFVGSRGGVQLFAASGSVRVVTDAAGAVTGVVGAGAAPQAVELALPGAGQPVRLAVAPNEEWAVSDDGKAPVLTRKVPFVAPY